MRTYIMHLDDEQPRDRAFSSPHAQSIIIHGVCGHFRLTAVSATRLILHNRPINIWCHLRGFVIITRNSDRRRFNGLKENSSNSVL